MSSCDSSDMHIAHECAPRNNCFRFRTKWLTLQAIFHDITHAFPFNRHSVQWKLFLLYSRQNKWQRRQIVVFAFAIVVSAEQSKHWRYERSRTMEPHECNHHALMPSHALNRCEVRWRTLYSDEHNSLCELRITCDQIALTWSNLLDAN